MLRRLGSHVRNQWAGFLALFLVLTGGVAYAANEWTGENIVDGSLTSADYKNNDIRSGDVLDDSLGSRDYKNNSIHGPDVLNDSLTGADIAEHLVGKVPSAAQAELLDGIDWGTCCHMYELISTSGPLPREALSFHSHGGKFLFTASGSGFRGTGHALGEGVIGMSVKVDGNFQGSAQVYTNELDSHKAFVTETFVTNLAEGFHTLSLEAIKDPRCGTADETPLMACTQTDQGDFFNVSAVELPLPV